MCAITFLSKYFRPRQCTNATRIRKLKAEGIDIAKAEGKYCARQQEQVDEDIYQYIYAKYMYRGISKNPPSP